jgi:hypothetical protein
MSGLKTDLRLLPFIGAKDTLTCAEAIDVAKRL